MTSNRQNSSSACSYYTSNSTNDFSDSSARMLKRRAIQKVQVKAAVSYIFDKSEKLPTINKMRASSKF